MTSKGMKLVLTKHKGYHNIRNFIETGTHKAQGLLQVYKHFKNVETIELAKPLYKVSLRRTKHTHIICHHGDSTEVLPKLSEQYKEATVFYLDAHYCMPRNQHIVNAQFPLWKELEMLMKRPYKDIIIIDDVHAFGNSYPKFKSNSIDWMDVSFKSIIEFCGNDKILDSFQVEDEFVIFKK